MWTPHLGRVTRVAHRHKFRYCSHVTNGSEIHFICSCGERRERKPTKEEWKHLKPQSSFKDSFKIHKVAHRFRELFKEDPGPTAKWKYEGYDLMVRVERWAKRQKPTIVRIVRCDDDVHAGAIMVFIEHKGEDRYMGTSVIVISQFETPYEFFLYPWHTKELQGALKDIRKQAVPVEKREARAANRDRKIVAAWRF